MIIVSIILFILLLASLYGCYNLVVQNEKLEESLLEQQEANSFYIEIIETVRQKVLDTEVELTQIDIRGSFEADDEVGFVFKNIKEISADLSKTIQQAYEYIEPESK